MGTERFLEIWILGKNEKACEIWILGKMRKHVNMFHKNILYQVKHTPAAKGCVLMYYK